MSANIILSNPHVFIINKLTVVFDNQGLKGIHVNWEFDEFFSNSIAIDYDTNKNGKFEKREIEKDEFPNLVNYQYFTFIKINGNIFKVKDVNDFSADLKNGKLYYKFFIPYHEIVHDTFKKFIISQHDPSYYTDVGFDKKIL